MLLRPSLFAAGILALSATALAQSGPATNRPNPPAPPRSDAPGAPVNPRQTTPAGAAAQMTPPNQAPAAAAEPEAPSTPLREMKFAEADADGDKKVTLTEFSNYVGARPASASVEPLTEEVIERFRQLDRDGDAALTESEASAPRETTPPQGPAIPPRR